MCKRFFPPITGQCEMSAAIFAMYLHNLRDQIDFLYT